ncbi:hypothetical protein [Thalassospira sp. CH_XMU1458]|uniref:hypothetical protein n=1 Tax=Thalassospira sp. CH_XMU1458 TaxID=3107776 RepID=UPI00300D4A4C
MNALTKNISELHHIVREAEQQLACMRESLGDLVVEREKVSASPMPKADAAKMIRQQVEGLAETFGQSIVVRTPQDLTSVKLDVAEKGTANPLGLQAWQNPEQLVANLIASYERTVTGQVRYSEADKATELARIDDAIFKLEVSEEQAVRALEIAGRSVIRRPDVAPDVVLASDEALGRALAESE